LVEASNFVQPLPAYLLAYALLFKANSEVGAGYKLNRPDYANCSYVDLKPALFDSASMAPFSRYRAANRICVKWRSEAISPKIFVQYRSNLGHYWSKAKSGV